MREFEIEENARIHERDYKQKLDSDHQRDRKQLKRDKRHAKKEEMLGPSFRQYHSKRDDYREEVEEM
jgi:hypothetical protein